MTGTQAFTVNWWARHHRLASNLFELPIGPTGWDRDKFPYLDGLCGEVSETPDDLTERENLKWMVMPDNHSTFVTHFWKNVFSDPADWHPKDQPNETEVICPLCGGECQFQVQPSEPTAPHTATCVYAPWGILKRELRAEGRRRNFEPRTSRYQEFVQENLEKTVESVRRSDLGSTSYLIRINDVNSKKHRHIAVRQVPSDEAPSLFGPWLVLAGVFETGISALVFRIDQLGPSGVHELTDEQIARLYE